MKKALLMAAVGMMGMAGAESTTVIQPVLATVTNVCTYAVNSQTNVNGETFTQGDKVIGTYNALGTTSASVDMGSFYIFRCTSGTPWDAAPYSKTGSIQLTNGDLLKTTKLVAEYTVTTRDQNDTINGDIHSAGVNFTIPSGQWQARSGSYSGELSVTINYN